MSKESLEGKTGKYTLSLDHGLSLEKRESTYVVGGSSTRYFAILNAYGTTSSSIPKGMRNPNIGNIEIELSEKVYKDLLEARGEEGSAYGKITIDLLSEVYQPKKSEEVQAA